MPMTESPYAYQNIVERRCPICQEVQTIVMTKDQYKRYLRWLDREGCIQDLLPDLDKDDREILISGICPNCWQDMFGEPPEENEVEEGA